MSAKGHVFKLIAAVALVMIAVIVIMVGTYAWYVVSRSPEIGGMQVSIGTGNTIQIAEDLTRRDEAGQVIHYPGEFSSHLNFAEKETYRTLLQGAKGLTPISTADGLHWFAPEFNDGQGNTVYREDTSLGQANITGDGDTFHGHYLCLDFWVVAPGADYTLRVATNAEQDRDTDSGSFLLALPAITVTNLDSDEGPDFSMSVDRTHAEASMRIGFLVNEEENVGSTAAYAGEEDYDSLRGCYQEKGQPLSAFVAGLPDAGEGNERYPTSFTVYEPNADLHPEQDTLADLYCITRPITGAQGTTADISSIVTAQKKSSWTTDPLHDDEYTTKIEEQLAAAVQYVRTNHLLDWLELRDNPELMLLAAGVAAQEMSSYLLNDYLQWQLAGVVDSGRFIDEPIYDETNDADVPVTISSLKTASATEGVSIVTLQGGTPQRIRMYIWVEGQDIDCLNDSSMRNLILNIELAGETRRGEP